MKISKILVENFGKFDRAEFEVRDKRLYVVSGRNGAGKSTLFVESLAWCLYGDLWRRAQKDDVIKDNKFMCRVVLFTDRGEIERRKERGKSSVVRVNGRVVSDLDVLNLVGLSKDMFFNSVVFGHALSGFLFLSDGERKELLAEVVYRDIDEVIVKLKEKKKKVLEDKKVLERELYVFERQISELGEKLRVLREKRESLGEVDKRVELLVERVKFLEEEINLLQRKLEEVSKVREVLESQSLELQGRLRSKEKEFFVCEERLVSLNEKIEKVGGLRVCSLCEREIDDEYREVLLKRLFSEREGIEKQREVIRGEMEELQRLWEDCLSGIGEKRKWESELRLKLRERFEELSVKREELVKVMEVKSEANELERLIMENERELERVREERRVVEQKMRELSVEEQGCDFWVDVLTKYKVSLFDKVLDVFDVIANEVLMRLSEGRFRVDLNVGVRGKKKVSEKFNIVLYDFGHSVVYERLSGGEKRLVSLGLNLALNYVLSRVYAGDFNLMVFDEVFDALDVRVRERVVDLLLEMVEKTGKSIVVITHDDFSYREDEFEKVVLV